jgi:hypothetical protein
MLMSCDTLFVSPETRLAKPDGRRRELAPSGFVNVVNDSALAAETRLFLLNEPSAALDALTSETLQESQVRVSGNHRPLCCSRFMRPASK